MASIKLVFTPVTTSIRLFKLNTTQSVSEKKYMSRVPYASFIGSLMYAMACTRPDLAQAISFLSKYLGNPGKEH